MNKEDEFFRQTKRILKKLKQEIVQGILKYVQATGSSVCHGWRERIGWFKDGITTLLRDKDRVTQK